MGIIYKLTFSSGASYIGLTTKSLSVRVAQHADTAKRSKRNSILYNAWRKYGSPVISIILAEAENHLLPGLERMMIAEHGTLYPNGYNTTEGGEESPMHSPIVAAKVSAAKMGKKRGPIHTVESKAKISLSLTGRESPLTGRKRSEESKRKQSITNTGRIPSAKCLAASKSKDAIAKRTAKMIGRSPSESNKISAHSPEANAKRNATLRLVWEKKKQDKLNASDL